MAFLDHQNRQLFDYSSAVKCLLLFVVLQLGFEHCSAQRKISFMSPNLTTNGDTIDIPTGSKVHLRCTGEKPMVWIFPNNMLDPKEQYRNLKVNSDCDLSEVNIYSPTGCWTEVTIPDVRFDMTGYYVCQYYVSNMSNLISIDPNVFSREDNQQKAPTNLADMVYIFVNDPANLMVPFDGQTDYLFLALFQHQPATIPCRPTYSNATMKMYKMKTNGIDSKTEIKPNSTLLYNPKKGFHFDSATWNSDLSYLECHFEVEGLPILKTFVSIHWTNLPIELNPLIDDSNALQIFENQTFTLRCYVHIENDVIIVIDWQYPNNKEIKRITKSPVDIQLTTVKGVSYNTISLNLTVTNATLDDQGEYRCNVTDGTGRIFSTVKSIHVHEKPPPLTFTQRVYEIPTWIVQFVHKMLLVLVI